MDTIGEIIRKRREKIGLKGIELAKKVGVHQSYITYIELHGKVPSPSVLQKIEKELGIDLKAEYIKEKIPAKMLESTAGRQYSSSMLPHMVKKAFLSPEAEDLVNFIYRNVSLTSMAQTKGSYESLLKEIAPEKVTDGKLFEQVLDIMNEMKKEKEEYWQRFIQQSKRIEALIDPKPQKPFFKPASPEMIANRPKPG